MNEVPPRAAAPFQDDSVYRAIYLIRGAVILPFVVLFALARWVPGHVAPHPLLTLLVACLYIALVVIGVRGYLRPEKVLPLRK